ncbi:MAG TPA: glycoside hydrolase family 88 protein [Prolixibacteraceae bacterium]|nr:glycoside hydrolase family 88 protein [Prolixibacteraceae bacterium]HPS12519.1 glycoside hydrolase family 88 protein [Prolixibacteraceae bacterium]
MKWIASFLLLLVFVACNPNSGKNPSEKTDEPKWSVKMANSVMNLHDSLIYYEGRDKIKWQYDVAMLSMAIDKLGVVDQKYSNYMKTYVDYFINDDGTVKGYNPEEYNLDRINPAKNLFTLYKRTGDEKYNKAIQLFVKQMENHPKTNSGGYWHKKVYPNQMWLDGIYMGSPFLAQYAREYNKPEWFDVVTHQITLIYDKTVDPKTALLYHAWDESKKERWANPETGQSPNFWSRSMGWYVMAIVDVLDYLPENHPDRAKIITLLNTTLDALLKVADKETGLWYQVLDQGNRKGNYIEASGTCMYIYAMAKAANKGYIKKKYLQIANEKFDSVIKNLIVKDSNDNLVLKNVCGGCGLGGNPYRDGSYEYYVTEKVVDNDSKGVGPFILAAIELNR